MSGVLHWKCIDKKGVKVCNTENPQEPNDIQTFDNLDTFKACEKCDSAARCIKSETGYSGFALKNKNKKNEYMDVKTADDCQLICQSAKGCNFFNFDNKQCRLKYGVGKKCDDCPQYFFGPKYCPGKYISFVTAILKCLPQLTAY